MHKSKDNCDMIGCPQCLNSNNQDKPSPAASEHMAPDELWYPNSAYHELVEKYGAVVAKLEAAEAEIKRLKEFEFVYKDLCK